MENQSACPYAGVNVTNEKTSNHDWWPTQLNLKVLQYNSPLADPMDSGFDYAKEFKSLDLALYGGNHFNGTQIGTSGLGYVQRAGLALECQGFPDAPNQENFPSIRLNPGETYSATTRWIISNSQNIGEFNARLP